MGPLRILAGVQLGLSRNWGKVVEPERAKSAAFPGGQIPRASYVMSLYKKNLE